MQGSRRVVYFSAWRFARTPRRVRPRPTRAGAPCVAPRDGGDAARFARATCRSRRLPRVRAAAVAAAGTSSSPGSWASSGGAASRWRSTASPARRRPASSTRSTSMTGGCAASPARAAGWCIASTGRSASTAASTTAPTGASSRSTASYADATVFQSRYSLEKHRELGLELRDPVVIPNAPDPAVFNADGRAALRRREPVRLITTSWSDNPRKGADVHRRARALARSQPLSADVRRPLAGRASSARA